MFGLRRIEDLRTLFFLFFHFFLTAWLWNAHQNLSVWTICAFLPFLAFTSFQGAVMTHNTMHCAMFHPGLRWANKFAQILLSLSYGHPVSTYVPGHNLSHHRYTQMRMDAIRTTKVQFKWHFLNGLLFQPIVVRDIIANEIRYSIMQYRLGRPWIRQALTEFCVLIVVQIVLVYLSWRKFLLYLYIPHFYAQWAIVSMNMLQHDGCDTADGSKGINCARNFTGKILNFLLMNNGYHTIHHRKPYMHWALLPEAHAKEIGPLIHPNLDQSSMLIYIFKTFIYPGIRQTYDGKPVTFENEGPDEDWVVALKEVAKKADQTSVKAEEDITISTEPKKPENVFTIVLAFLASGFVSLGSIFGPDDD